MRTLVRPPMHSHERPLASALMCRMVPTAIVTVLVAALAALAPPSIVHAQPYPNYPWCGSFAGGGGENGDSGGENCGFVTWAQCMDSVQPGGVCRNNPFYRPVATPATSTPRRKRARH